MTNKRNAPEFAYTIFRGPADGLGSRGSKVAIVLYRITSAHKVADLALSIANEAFRDNAQDVPAVKADLAHFALLHDYKHDDMYYLDTMCVFEWRFKDDNGTRAYLGPRIGSQISAVDDLIRVGDFCHEQKRRVVRKFGHNSDWAGIGQTPEQFLTALGAKAIRVREFETSHAENRKRSSWIVDTGKEVP